MTKEDCVAYILRVLHRDYGIRWACGEDAIVILKLLVAVEEVEKAAQQQIRDALRHQVWLN